MTSKALEAAAQKLVAYAHGDGGTQALLEHDFFKEEVERVTAEIIRAFAQNISEEAAAEFVRPVKFQDGGVVAVAYVTASAIDLCAAIEKDLE